MMLLADDIASRIGQQNRRGTGTKSVFGAEQNRQHRPIVEIGRDHADRTHLASQQSSRKRVGGEMKVRSCIDHPLARCRVHVGAAVEGFGRG